jgi:hypothetical protein
MAKRKYIETPEKLWEYFENYKAYIDRNPIRKQDYVGKDATLVYRELQRPYTMEGFENYLANNDIIEDLGQYLENRDNRYSEYVAICSRIKREIKQNQIEGGMAGIYNPSITQRLNGLVEKQENNVKIQDAAIIDWTKPSEGNEKSNKTP